MRPSTAPALSAGSGGAPFLPGLSSGTPRSRLSKGRNRKPRTEAEGDEAEEALVKSLHLKSDARYAKMNHYEQRLAERYACEQLGRAKKPNGRMVGLEEEPAVVTKASNLKDMFSQGTGSRDAAGERAPRTPVAGSDGRLEWQESFDHEFTRLLVDFQLSDVPACRLNHLERMHNWFEEHGAKPARKKPEGPSYLTADRSEKMWEGSTKDLPRNVKREHLDGNLVPASSSGLLQQGKPKGTSTLLSGRGRSSSTRD